MKPFILKGQTQQEHIGKDWFLTFCSSITNCVSGMPVSVGCTCFAKLKPLVRSLCSCRYFDIAADALILEVGFVYTEKMIAGLFQTWWSDESKVMSIIPQTYNTSNSIDA